MQSELFLKSVLSSYFMRSVIKKLSQTLNFEISNEFILILLSSLYIYMACPIRYVKIFNKVTMSQYFHFVFAYLVNIRHLCNAKIKCRIYFKI